VHALPLMLASLAAMAIAYRFYSAFLAARVAALDDSRLTPAVRLDDGQNYHPTHPWVLFGHHFAAISGAGPLIGPVLAIQFGYMPGLIWLVVGVCLAGAVQDMMVLAASVRHDGRSLAEIIRRQLGGFPGTLAAISILFIVVIALSGLGLVVVKALGGEEIKLAEGMAFTASEPFGVTTNESKSIVRIPAGTEILYPNGAKVKRSEPFEIVIPADSLSADATSLVLPKGCIERVKGSSWGTFTIFCTIPIALLVGLYMYKIRKGRVFEASLIGAVAVLAATIAGNWIPGSPWESLFSLNREGTILAICIYGFVASVLPVWILLCPRDYLSSFLKIGTIALLVVGILVANPKLEAPAVNEFFSSGGGPYFNGAIFPFVFICIMCGAISGFHSLVSSGTTPKMVALESHVRRLGYGGMLLEGLVGVVALLSAAALPQGDYWAINIDLSRSSEFAGTLEKMGAGADHLAQIEQQVGGESLRGRTGGAVTLAVGMAQVLTTAVGKISGSINIDSMIKYWYHFAIMFEALFILTTIDTGTRIARFLLQEVLGKVHKPFERMDWTPGVLLSTSLVVLGWGGLIWTGSIDTIWPMFGIANQLLAAIALTMVTTYLVQEGRRRWIFISLLPLAFVTSTTLTASYQMVTGRFWAILSQGWKAGEWPKIIQGGLNITMTVFLLISFLVILSYGASQWLSDKPRTAKS
jgi:carbon starvation protein